MVKENASDETSVLVSSLYDISNAEYFWGTSHLADSTKQLVSGLPVPEMDFSGEMPVAIVAILLKVSSCQS